MAKFIAPEDDMAALESTSKEVVKVTREEAVTGVKMFAKRLEFEQDQVDQQTQNILGRMTSEQWLDENEREWAQMDSMLRSRPWSKNTDKHFTYPFRKVSNDMRKTEGPWTGDDRILAPEFTRFEAEDEVLTHIRPTTEYPPGRRVILFTPEFGGVKSYDFDMWENLLPKDDCDIWVCSWQGWSSYVDMMDQVCRKLLSFGDGTSTVWFGHSTGALIAYEMLKKFEKHHTPNLPVALMVSGCPAPFLFSDEYKPLTTFPWIGKARYMSDLDHLSPEEFETLKHEFQMGFDAAPSFAQRKCLLGDCRILKRYKHVHEALDMKVVVPVLAFSHDADPLVSEESVQAWSECSAPGFEFVNLAVGNDIDACYEKGHGYAKRPVAQVIRKINEWTTKHKRVTDQKALLQLPQCDIGTAFVEPPKEVDLLVVGGGIAGVHATVAAYEQGMKTVCVDRYDGLGGIWNYYANQFSRVNTSEVSYRIVTQEGATSRPNEDHSPTHDIMRDIYTVAAKAHGCFRLKKEVTKVDTEADGTYTVHIQCLFSGSQFKTKAKGVCFAINRRLGKRRDLLYPGEERFLGEVRYGYANEVLGLDFWGRRVIVVGSGAFAFENLRTSLEHGAKHVTILGRRAGTTCPKWIDIIAFLRPSDENFNTNRAANALSFEAWRKCYEDADLPTPDCWAEGLLKPHNHTVSVSDMAFIGGRYGLVDLQVGEIRAFRADGQGVFFRDGSQKEVDIVIKCTGFHLNQDVPKICGSDKMYPWGNIKFNMFYQAEPLLDGGQFGSAKGNVSSMKDAEVEAEQMRNLLKGLEKLKELGLPDIVSMKANPFGSGYVGGMIVGTKYQTWLMANPEEQKIMLKASGQPNMNIVKLWISGIYTAVQTVSTRLVSSLGEQE